MQTTLPDAPDIAPPRHDPLRIGLIGLGLMGRGMGFSLLRAGHTLGVVANRRRETADELNAAGAWEAEDPGALAVACDVPVLCLPAVEATEAVLFGPRGVVAGARPGLLVIECSTLLPAAGRSFAQRLAALALDFVDAPVMRGSTEALAGRLNALLSGSPAAVDRAAAVLTAFYERRFRFGASGQGYAAKLVNNFLAFSNLVAATEAMHTAQAAGLDLAELLAAVQVSGGQNRVLDGLAPWLTGTGPSRSRVTVLTAHKDVAYYQWLTRSLASAGPLAQQVEASLAQALACGLGEQLTPEYLRHVAQGSGVLAGLPPSQGCSE